MTRARRMAMAKTAALMRVYRSALRVTYQVSGYDSTPEMNALRNNIRAFEQTPQELFIEQQTMPSQKTKTVHLSKLEHFSSLIYAATFFQNWTPNDPAGHAKDCVKRAQQLIKALDEHDKENRKKA